MTLDESVPVIWRRMDIRSDMPLNLVHLAIQAAFNWFDYHLNRFTIGGGPWDRHSQAFACREDIREADEDDQAILDSLVRLDETLQEPGDVMHYLYDYGDNWAITIKLEEVLPWMPQAPGAWCVDGERAAPPEDCGHLLTEEELAGVVDDPAAFDLDAINTELSQSCIVLTDLGVIPALVELVNRLGFTDIGPDVTARAYALSLELPELSEEDWRVSLLPHQWFLERAGDTGIALTPAGYLKPVDVVQVAPLMPTMPEWLRRGPSDREGALYPLMDFRQSLQRLGLLRKSKGRLLITKAGRRARDDSRQLRRHPRTRELMNASIRDVLIEGYEPLLDAITLPDPDDRHVVAAAIRAHAQLIVTTNLRDFPPAELEKWDIEARHPDDFLVDQFHLDAIALHGIVQQIADDTVRPPLTFSDVLNGLERDRDQGLPAPRHIG